MAYRSGELNRKISVERDRREPDGAGGHKVVPQIIARPWAKYRNNTTREFLQAQQVQSGGTGVFVIRNRDDLLAGDRIILGNTKFNIAGIPPYDPSAAFMEIDVENGVAN